MNFKPRKLKIKRTMTQQECFKGFQNKYAFAYKTQCSLIIYWTIYHFPFGKGSLKEMNASYLMPIKNAILNATESKGNIFMKSF